MYREFTYQRTFFYHRGSDQQCCYNPNGKIITGSPSGGTADLVAPTNWKTTILHFRKDVLPWVYCCTGLFKDCSRYYDRRQSDDCSDYPQRPPPGNTVIVLILSVKSVHYYTCVFSQPGSLVILML